jgi:hypothetical protein
MNRSWHQTSPLRLILDPANGRSSCGEGARAKTLLCTIKETTAVLVNKPRVPPNGSHITLGCDCIGEIAAAEEEQPPLRIHRLRRDAIIRRPSQANGNRDSMTSAVTDNLTNLACGYVAPISTAGKVQGLTTWRHGGCECPDLNLAPQ